ncbi:patatin-like phospholipase family protein [Nocardia alba]|uniref:NTE family protein n=1 Tax=Nocardia alba TaxID=225051 RepID=A0A4R1G0Y4_9NOCA|nr:patatin-like phospholipase family protein [Nocardia alba]TCJ99862.1 NTE family protein [Nocardia alba]
MAAPSTALVLGNGGIVGIGWQIGMIAGLAEAGVDLRSADLVIGTSAGAVVGAQIRSELATDELYQRQLRRLNTEIPNRLSVRHLARWALVAGTAPSATSAARRVANASRGKSRVDPVLRLAAVSSRLPEKLWPTRPLWITAVDADTGVLKVFDRDSDVSLAEAVNASCAVPFAWPAASCDGRHYLGGGVRSPMNLDLAKGYGRIVGLASNILTPRRSGKISAQLGRLGAAEATVILPDHAARKAIGPNELDPQRVHAAARAGRTQAIDFVDEVRAVWPVG